MERRRKYAGNKFTQNARFCLTVYNRQRHLPINKASVRRLVSFVVTEHPNSLETVSLYFVSLDKIQKLHAQFFDDPSPTDCITFPIQDLKEGEIFICPQAALDYDPSNPYLETSLYVIHGLLHLMGYDDIDKKKRTLMHKQQNHLLKKAQEHQCTLQA